MRDSLHRRRRRVRVFGEELGSQNLRTFTRHTAQHPRRKLRRRQPHPMRPRPDLGRPLKNMALPRPPSGSGLRRKVITACRRRSAPPLTLSFPSAAWECVSPSAAWQTSIVPPPRISQAPLGKSQSPHLPPVLALSSPVLCPPPCRSQVPLGNASREAPLRPRRGGGVESPPSSHSQKNCDKIPPFPPTLKRESPPKCSSPSSPKPPPPSLRSPPSLSSPPPSPTKTPPKTKTETPASKSTAKAEPLKTTATAPSTSPPATPKAKADAFCESNLSPLLPQRNPSLSHANRGNSPKRTDVFPRSFPSVFPSVKADAFRTPKTRMH